MAQYLLSNQAIIESKRAQKEASDQMKQEQEFELKVGGNNGPIDMFVGYFDSEMMAEAFTLARS